MLQLKEIQTLGILELLMVGVKNTGTSAGDACAEVWFNELRMSDMDNEGGWAAIISMDTNFADFANVSATGRKVLQDLGALEQDPKPTKS